MSDIERILEKTKEIESLLEKHFGGIGRGLHEKITSADCECLKGVAGRKARMVATMRNKAVHEPGSFDPVDMDAFLKSANYVIAALEEERQTASEEEEQTIIIPFSVARDSEQEQTVLEQEEKTVLEEEEQTTLEEEEQTPWYENLFWYLLEDDQEIRPGIMGIIGFFSGFLYATLSGADFVNTIFPSVVGAFLGFLLGVLLTRIIVFGGIILILFCLYSLLSLCSQPGN